VFYNDVLFRQRRRDELNASRETLGSREAPEAYRLSYVSRSEAQKACENNQINQPSPGQLTPRAPTHPTLYVDVQKEESNKMAEWESARSIGSRAQTPSMGSAAHSSHVSSSRAPQTPDHFSR
jgi:hypothetical protein